MKLNATGKLRLASRILSVLGGLGVAGHALAQETPAAKPVAEAKKLEGVQVTGSRISRIDAEGASPVTVITKSQIEKNGYVSVTEVLNDLTQNSGGTISNQGSLFGSTGSASSVDLRTFGAGRTLILLDGRRLPVFPNDFSGTQSADLTSVPFAAVERIEVLTEGASAIYGSDAVGGVVNIITKKKFDGVELTGRIGGTDHGGYANRRYQLVGGGTISGGNLLITADLNENDPLFVSQRKDSRSDFSGSGNGSLFGSNFAASDGSVLLPDPNCGTPNDSLGGLGVLVAGRCRFDRTPFRQYFPDFRSVSGSVRFDKEFGSISSSTRVYLYENSTNAQAEPNAYGGGEGFRPPAAQLIDPSVHNFGEVPAGAPNNPTTGTGNEVAGSFQRRLVEFGPRRQSDRVQALSLTQTIGGSVFDLDWDAGVTLARIRLDSSRPNIFSSLLDNEVANNGLDLFQPIPQATVDRLSFTSLRNSESRSLIADATISGATGIKLPAGDVQFSLHGEFQRSSYEDLLDPVTLTGDAFDGGTSGSGSRRYYAAGVELLFPILDHGGQKADVTFAGRYDKYDDASQVGGAFNPKVSLLYSPIKEIKFRASYAEIFRAPTLQDLFGGQTVGFSTVQDPTRCLQLGGTPDQVGSPIPACNPDDPFYQIQSAQVATGSNKNLKEETGKSINLGFVIQPIKELSFSVDYYEVKLKNIVQSLAAQEVLDFCAFQGLYCDSINRPAGTIDTNADGQTLDEPGVFISAVNQNLAFRKVRGFDFTTDFKATVAEWGAFNSRLTVSRIQSLKTQSVSTAPIEEVIDQSPISSERVPQVRATWTNDFSRESWGVYVRGNYVDRIVGDNVPTGLIEVPKDQYFPKFITWDSQVRMTFKRATLRLGVDNIFDRKVPLDPTAIGGLYPNQFIGNAATAYASPLGRSGYLQIETKF